jgi:hypothetical protein
MTPGTCTTCGGSDLFLALDYTSYHPTTYNPTTGKWKASVKPLVSPPDAIRFFCTSCGTQHPVPQELL